MWTMSLGKQIRRMKMTASESWICLCILCCLTTFYDIYVSLYIKCGIRIRCKLITCICTYRWTGRIYYINLHILSVRILRMTWKTHVFSFPTQILPWRSSVPIQCTYALSLYSLVFSLTMTYCRAVLAQTFSSITLRVADESWRREKVTGQNEV